MSSSGATMMMLKARGPQDIALVSQPEVTLFKSIYPRHTNFSWEDTEITQATGQANYGQMVEFKLTRAGDLITKVYLVVQMSAVPGWDGAFSPFIWDFPRALIEYVEFNVGGYNIERVTGDMLHVWDILERTDYASYVENMPVKHGASVKFGKDGKIVDNFDGTSPQYLYIPLDFSFTQDPGLALPMIALSWHEVRVKVKFNTADKIFTSYSLAKPSYDSIPGVVGGVIKDTLNSASPVWSANKLYLRALIRKMFVEGSYGNEMCQLVSETGDKKWVQHVIDNALYNNKIVNVNGVVTAPGLDVDGTLIISFEIAEYNALVGGSRVFQLRNSTIKDEDKFETSSVNTVLNRRSVWSANPPSFACRLLCRYVYLDDYERQQFAKDNHEFLITENQLHTQYVSGQEQVTIDLKFNHPTKELIFFYRPDDYSVAETSAKGFYKGYWSFRNPNSTFGEGHLFRSANLILNSQNMYGDGRDPVYFSYVTTTQYHKRYDADHRIYVIPLCLSPGSWKPSGSVNMSRLDDVKLVLTGMGSIPPGTISVYARNYNLFSIQSGMGGKRYAS